MKMLKQVIFFLLLPVSLNTLHSQELTESLDSCEYLESNPSKYDYKFIEYRVFSPSPDNKTNLNLRYHLTDETYPSNNPYMRFDAPVHHIRKTLEITIHNFEPPKEKYLIKIVLNDGKILKRKNLGREEDQTVYISTDITQKTTVAKISPPIKVWLSKKQLKALQNSTIKEIRINGETTVIEAEQAKIIQSGAVCMFEKIYDAPKTTHEAHNNVTRYQSAKDSSNSK